MASEEDDREWLEVHEEAIIEQLDPARALPLLRHECPNGLDSRDEDDILLKHVTPRERTEALLAVLHERTPEAREALRRVIFRLHPHLARVIQPVRYQVLWLTPSPQHAAVVVHVLETYAESKFSPVEEVAPECLVRWGFVFGEKDVLVKLVFPVKPELFSDMLAEAVRERREERVNLALLTGSCDAVSPEATIGQALIPTSASKGGCLVGCLTAERVKGRRESLRQRLGEASWRSELRELYKRHAYMDYCAVCLGRLYADLQCRAGGERSQWLEMFGWGEGGVQNESNRACLSAKLPEWETGRLANCVLREKRTWRVDASSPLGLAPREDLLSRISEKKGWYDHFPALIEGSAPSGPVFSPLSTPGEGGVAMDTNTQEFYEACSQRLGPETAWLACVCVCNDSASASHELTAFTSVTMAMEVVQLLRTASTT